jgi:hypothetical protein
LATRRRVAALAISTLAVTPLGITTLGITTLGVPTWAISSGGVTALAVSLTVAGALAGVLAPPARRVFRGGWLRSLLDREPAPLAGSDAKRVLPSTAGTLHGSHLFSQVQT